MVSQVLQHPVLRAQPPVLLDVGASGQIHTKWRNIARYAVCIAFDADKRDFTYSTTEGKGYRKLHLYHALLADKVQTEATFHLTASPHCSSLLPPDAAGLRFMAWADRFQVVEKVQMPTKDIATVLQDLELGYIDWFKTDSQGIDLRLFKSLPTAIRERVLVAEFEPGIINAYQGEDKLFDVLAYMHEAQHFWLAHLDIKGSARISPQILRGLSKKSFWRKLLMFSLPNSADWGEMTYLHTLEKIEKPTLRDMLLAWVFAVELKHLGWAIHLAERGLALYPEETLWENMLRYTRKKMWAMFGGFVFSPL